jgi:hypothetical protein
LNIQQCKSVLTTFINNNVDVTPLFWGPHGTGKTEFVKQVAKELGYEYIQVMLSQIEAVDLMGVMYMDFDKDLNASVTDYHPQRWFLRALKKKKVIIHLDEMNRARPEVLKAAFQFVLGREINGHKLPPETAIVVSCNPNDERYTVTEFEDALVDRFMHVKVEPSVDEWLTWARQKNDKGQYNIHPDVVAYIATDKKAFRDVNKADSVWPVTINRSGRSWERLSKIHALDMAPELARECFQGMVGLDVAIGFMKSLASVEKPLTAKQIFDLTDDTKDKIARFTDPTKVARLELLKLSIENLIEYSAKNKAEALKHKENVCTFICMLPNDLTITAVHGLHEDVAWAKVLMSHDVILAKMQTLNKVLTSAQKATGTSAQKTTGRTSKPRI